MDRPMPLSCTADSAAKAPGLQSRDKGSSVGAAAVGDAPGVSA
eukprot:CAMPEP_0170571306 /NCGR_PEP_ID=MMETSP0224-20130122/1604_1 /TAXON_ID=285029 /ORGANISM="Togula jolla, Strain CCCM 725" /LENGTH=42 /DNA_ID= /DNA_START= /DNA_END= /DNA_ORIENTATION=